MRRLGSESVWVGEEEITDSEVVVVLRREELLLLAGAINEVLEAVEDWEFDTRVGATTEEARALRAQIRDLLHATRRPE